MIGIIILALREVFLRFFLKHTFVIKVNQQQHGSYPGLGLVSSRIYPFALSSSSPEETFEIPFTQYWIMNLPQLCLLLIRVGGGIQTSEDTLPGC